jgi:hypothetical protein
MCPPEREAGTMDVGRTAVGRAVVLLALGLAGVASPAAAQQLLDRVVARVDGYAITLTDVNAALALGVVEAPAGADPQAAAVQRLIDRQLLLTEVARFAPPEPDPAAVRVPKLVPSA